MNIKFKIGDEVVVTDIGVQGEVIEIRTRKQRIISIHTPYTTYRVKCEGESDYMQFREDQLTHKNNYVENPELELFLLELQINQSLVSNDKESFLVYTEERRELLSKCNLKPMKL